MASNRRIYHKGCGDYLRLPDGYPYLRWDIEGTERGGPWNCCHEGGGCRAGISFHMIDDVRFECCMEPADGLNVAGVSALMAVTLLYAMKRRGKTLGLATLCGGGGISMACAFMV